MKRAFPVPDDTGCFYELPSDTNTAQMKEYEKWAKSSFLNFHSRKGRRLFFQFNITRDRDNFLAALKKSLIEGGNIVQELTL